MEAEINKSIPNLVSLSRIIGGFLVLYAVTHQGYLLSIILFSLFLLTDKLDGYLARKFKSTSKLGAEIDSASDFIFVSLVIIGAINVLGILYYYLLIPGLAVLILWLCQFIFPKARTTLSKILIIFGFISFIIAFSLLLFIWITRA